MLSNTSKEDLKHESENMHDFRTGLSHSNINISDQNSTMFVFLQALEKGIIAIGEGMKKQYNEELIAKKKSK